MRNITILFFLLTGMFGTVSLQAQSRKIDTTASQGDVGYRVWCNNKNENEIFWNKSLDKEIENLIFSSIGGMTGFVPL